jgi:hypothetical protein
LGRSNARVRARCGDPVRVVPPPAGLEPEGRSQARADRHSETPPPAIHQNRRGKACGRSLGKPRPGCWPGSPKREKPKGASSGRRVKPRRSPGMPGRVKAQEPRPVGPALRFGGGNNRRAKTAGGCIACGNAGDTFRAEKAPKGKIPRAPPARNKAGPDSEGESRREGSQTLRTDPSGRRHRPQQWISEPCKR